MNKNMLTNIKSSILNLLPPSNISYSKDFKSLLGLFVGVQLISGFFLSMHYCTSTSMAFSSSIHIMQNVTNWWMFYNIHINSSIMFFFCSYMYISQNFYFTSFNLLNTWMSGVTMLLLSMATAFLGYVLPWGQMSFCGTTVITNLVSPNPYISNNIVMWVWGGFPINTSTLNRFYFLHFILSFIILMMEMIF